MTTAEGEICLYSGTSSEAKADDSCGRFTCVVKKLFIYQTVPNTLRLQPNLVKVPIKTKGFRHTKYSLMLE